MRCFMSFLIALSGLMVVSTSVAQAKDRLVMFDSRSCGACIVFKRETAGPYRNSRLGKKLPLRIVDARKGMRKYGNKIRPIGYTPTFILVRNGREIARSVGYNGRINFMRDIRKMSRR